MVAKRVLTLVRFFNCLSYLPVKIQIRTAIKTQTRFNAGYVSIYFQEDPSPPKKSNSNAKKTVFCHVRCRLIGLTNKNVWQKTAGITDLIFITDVSWPFQKAIYRFVINASFFRSCPNCINWQIPPSGRKETNAFCFYKCSLLTIWLMCHGHFKEEVQRWLYFSFFRNF